MIAGRRRAGGVGTLPVALLALALFAPAPVRATDEVVRTGGDAVARWHAEIAEAASRIGLPEVWIERVMAAESRGHTTRGGRPMTSSAGAMGLMQLMPATWAELRARLGLGSDPYLPRDNILAGAAYLRDMYDRFGYPGLFAAYNAGPARYASSLRDGRPLPAETRAYLASVAGPAALAGQVSSPMTWRQIGDVGSSGVAGSSAASAASREQKRRQTLFIGLSSVAATDGPVATSGEETLQSGRVVVPAVDALFAVRTGP